MPVSIARSEPKVTRWPSRFLGGLLLSVPVLVWAWTLTRYALDVVHDDDYTLLGFVSQWIDPAATGASRLAGLFALHNTHRIVLDRLVTLGSYYGLGRLDFRVLIGLGNLALAGIGWQFWRSFRAMRWPVWYFLPVPCWLFSLQSHENMFWAMAALQNFTVIWLILETLHQLHRRAWLGWPLLLGVVATLTSGNGLLAFVAGAGLLATQPGRGRALVVWLVSTAVVLGLMLGFGPAGEAQTSVLTWLPNSCLLLGGAFTNTITTAGPMLGGVVLGAALMLAGLLWLLQRGPQAQRLRQTAPTAEWLAIGMVVLATALLLAMHRTPAEMLRDRYKIYAHLTLAVVYLLGLVLVGQRGQRIWAVGAVLLAVAMNAEAYRVCLPRIVADYQNRQTDAANFRHYGTTLTAPYFRRTNDSLLHYVEQKNIYQFPDPFGPPAQWIAAKLSDSLTISTFRDAGAGNVFIGRNPLFVQMIEQHLPRHLSDGTDHDLYLVVEGPDRRRFLLPAPPAEGGLRRWLTGGGAFRPGFSSSFLGSRLGAGTYRLGVLQVTGGRSELLDAGQTLTLPSP
jgi:hypothetical protein